ncbi:MAG: L-lactate dehydrogenase [Lachnospiraceae bacterium]|jgi:L-lactate dehydrogenase|nr:L-lactate dehydrogenase [Lachnospiraceae bacterium]
MEVTYGKLVIIGAGKVGDAVLNSALRMNLLDDIVVVNRNRDKALGAVLDASHTTAFEYSTNASVRVGDYEDCRDAHVIVITAGPSIVPGGSQDRNSLLAANVEIMDGIFEKITHFTKKAIIIMISNPLDVLTYVMAKKYSYPVSRIFGTGTLLDTARFNRMLGDLCGVDAKNVTGFVLGEHGSTSFIPWNTVNIVGVPVEEMERKFGLVSAPDREKLLHDTKVIGPNIVQLKGYTSAGVALAACRLIGAIVRNEHCVVPISTVMTGQYGISDVAMSLPCVVGKEGIEQTIELTLDEQGKHDLEVCHRHLRELIDEAEAIENRLHAE